MYLYVGRTFIQLRRENMKYQDILAFWFKEIDQSQWWIKDLEFDNQIIAKYQNIHTAAKCCELFSWRNSAEGRLAEIIILDQFSRNMFRDTPQSFACDTLALALSQEAISIGADKALNEMQRSFLYMPFMHSESLIIHELAVDLYQKNGVQSNLGFEIKHKNIIERFGRYPHRNHILGRTSTDEEVEFLTQPGSSF
jgi:uncharacterized protein (DUF924 family)